MIIITQNPKEIKAGLSAASAKYIISAVHVLFSLANHIYSGYTAKDTKTHHKLFWFQMAFLVNTDLEATHFEDFTLKLYINYSTLSVNGTKICQHVLNIRFFVVV